MLYWAAEGRIPSISDERASAVTNRISKTSRLLSTCHLFCFCREVEYDELTKAFSVSRKTVRRDLCALQDAGVLRVRFDRTAGTVRRGALVPVSQTPRPIAMAEGAPGRRSLERLRRLCVFMYALQETERGDPVALYRTLFPDRTDRTRQRDFSELRVIGYLRYGAPTDDEPKYWSIEIPDTYGLDTIPEEMR